MRDLQKLTQYAARRKRSRRFRGILTAIAAVVVFCTTYALILPAITLEGQTVYCGFEDHTHTEDCYQLACGKEEFIPHYHSAECRDQNGELVCHQEETTIHVHSDKCKVALTCTQPEREAHQHSEGCYETQSVLVCGSAEAPGHTHGEGCYQSVNVCGLEETPGHAHGEGCYAEDGSLSCTQEEAAGHSHSEGCFTSGLVCTQEEAPGHSHTESCYQAQSVLVCQKEEGEGHTHNDDCYGTFEDFRCGQEGKEAHGHTASCFTLACDAHVHTEECYVKPQEDPTQVTGEEEQTIQEEETIEENEEEIIPEDEEEIIQENEEEIIQEDEEAIIQENEEAIIPEDEGEAEEPSVRDLLLEIYTEEELQELLEAYPDCTLEDIWTMLNNPPAGGEPSGNWQSPSGGEQDPAPQANDNVTTTETLNLESYLTGVAADPTPSYKEDKNAIELGMKYSFTFPQTNGQFPSYDYELQLKNIDLSKLIASNALELDKEYSLNNPDEGVYQFIQKEDGYYLHVKLNEAYVANATQQIDGEISFAGHLDASKLDSDGVFDSSYTNSDGEKFELSFSPKDYYGGNSSSTLDYQISAQKTGGCVDGNKLRYTVQVTTTKGTPNFTFTDRMQIQGAGSSIISEQNKSISVKKVTKDGEGNTTDASVDVTPKSWTIATNETGDSTTADISMELPALAVNESYEITYEYDLNDLGESYNYNINNTATVTGSGDKGQTVTTNAYGYTSLSNSIHYQLDKTGSYDDGKNTNTDPKIHWEIYLNNNNMDITGMELTDDMFEAGVPITIDPSNENYRTENYEKEVNGEIKTFQKIVFLAPEGEAGNTQSYKISYDTAAPPAYFGTTTQNNTATITKNGVVTNKSASVSYESGSISKTLTSMTVPEGETLPVLNWKVCATVPEGGVKAGTVLSDYFGEHGGAGNHQIIRGTVNILDAAGETISGVTVKYYEYAYSYEEAGEGQPTYCFKILFDQDYTGGDFTVTYQTRANAGSTGSDKFYNAAASGNLKSESYNPVVTKNGTLSGADAITWNLTAKTGLPSSSVITLEDTLPEGTYFAANQENLKIGVQYVWQKQVMTVQDGGPFTKTGSDDKGTDYQYSCWYTESTRQLIIEIKRVDGQPIAPDKVFEVEYTTAVNTQWIENKMATNGEYSHFLTNQLQSKFDETTLLPVSKTIQWFPNLSQLENALGKDGVYDEENHVLNYTLKVNPDGVKLNPDPDPNASTLTLKDVLSYKQGGWGMSIIYKLGSVQVYTVDGNGQRGPALPRSRWDCTYSDNTAGLTNDNKDYYEIQKTLTLTVPDKMALIVTYQYDVDIRDYKDYSNATVQWINNNVQLTSGDYHVPEKNDTKMSYKAFATQGSLSTVNKYSFLKSSSADGTALAGAEFGIWKAVQTDDQWAWQPVTLTSAAGKKTSSYTSGSAGTFAVSKNDGYEDNVLYMVKEVKAPHFYQMPDNPPEYCFFFSNTNSPSNTMPASDHPLRKGAIDLSLTVGMAEITNSPVPTTSITIQKKWLDTDGETTLTEGLPESITVSLYRRTAETKEDVEPVEENIQITPGDDNSWSVTRTGLPVEEGKEYFITEAPVNGFKLYSIDSGANSFTLTNVKTGAKPVSIQVEKTWENGDAALDSVNFQLFRRVWDHEPSEEEIAAEDSYAQYNPSLVGSQVVSVDNVTIFQLSQEENWKKTFTDLPAEGKTDGEREYYTYYIVEEPSSLYSVTYTKQEAASGILTLKNTKTPRYELPQTGGTGTGLSTLAGLTLCAGAALGLMKKRKKGDCD